MSNIYIGVVTTTHGIKGELKIKSNFQYKEKILKKGNTLIIDNQEYIIKTHRIHKNLDMVTLNNYTNINEVLFLLKKKVYFDEQKLTLTKNEVLDSDLIKYNVISTDNKKGTIKEIFYASKENKIIRIMFDKEVLIPFNSPMLKSINKEKKEVIVELLNW